MKQPQKYPKYGYPKNNITNKYLYKYNELIKTHIIKLSY